MLKKYANAYDNLSIDPKLRHTLILVVIGLVFLFAFRAKYAFFLYPAWDDVCYLEWLYESLKVPHQLCPTYEMFGKNYFFPGAAISWFPLAWVASWIAEITEGSSQVWILSSIGLTAFLCWAIGLIFIDKTFRLSQSSALRSVHWPILFILSVPILHYCIARTTMSHATEFMISCVCVYLICSRKYIWSLLFISWLVATRINDAPMILLLLGKLLDDDQKTPFNRNKLFGLILALSSVALICWLVLIRGYATSGPEKFLLVLQRVSLFHITRLLFGDYGLSWSAFSWLAILVCGLFYCIRLSWMSRAATLWMLIMFAVCAGWETTGGDAFGYRYLIGTYLGALVVFIELVNRFPRVAPFLKASVFVQAIILTTFTWVYHTRLYISITAMEEWLYKIPLMPTLIALGPIGLLTQAGVDLLQGESPALSALHYFFLAMSSGLMLVILSRGLWKVSVYFRRQDSNYQR